jgi:RNA polymerase sigma factor (TIGR02999 family)
MQTRESVTDLLALASAGDRAALDRAFPLVYEELRRLARRQLRGQDAGQTLSTTALVHEAYLRLIGAVEHPRADAAARWQDRRHFFAIAATAMRRILVDHARRFRAGKRGAAPTRVPIESVDGLANDDRADFVLALDDALERLAAIDDRQARVVECRFFGGYSEEETATTLGIGLRTAKRDWAKARAWLYAALNPDELPAPRATGGT